MREINESVRLESEPPQSRDVRASSLMQRVASMLLSFSVVAGSACAPEATIDGESASEQEQQRSVFHGTVVVYTTRFDDGFGENQYFMRTRNGELRLYFDKEPDLLPGTALRVVGAPLDDGLRVLEYHIEETLGVANQSLINATPYKARSFAFVLVDTGSGVNLTKAEAQKRLFGTNAGDRSVKQYYKEVSYGTQDITGDVFGPLTYRMTGCNTRSLADTLKSQLGVYDHYLWYLGARNTSCGWGGLAESGLPSRPTNDSWYNGSAGCVVLVQEPGHNFGMMHSSSMTCGTSTFADDPDATCTHVEYGDRYDPMGGACNHMNAWQKVFEGWLQKCNGVTVRTSGTYTLQPLELACDGPQVLQIPMPKVRPFGRSGGGGSATVENLQYYYLELRTARGFDDTIRNAPTVLVRVAEDFRARTDRGRHTWILDMDPTTRTIDGLSVGKTFTDPAGGVSFKVTAMSADSASIQVTVPASGAAMGNTCLDDTRYDPAVTRTCAGLAAVGGTADAGPSSDAGTIDVPPPRIEAFVLVDADTDKDIREIEDGAVLDLNLLPPNLTLRVDTDPPTIGSVTFRIDGGQPRTESIAPYSVSSDDGRGDFIPWTLSLGAHTVNAVGFDAANGVGRPGEPFEIDFTLTRGGLPEDASVPSAPDAAVQASLGDAGTEAGVGSTVGDAGVDASVSSAALEPRDVSSGCGCRTLGGPADETAAPRAWALAALALGLFARRRRTRKDAPSIAS